MFNFFNKIFPKKFNDRKLVEETFCIIDTETKCFLDKSLLEKKFKALKIKLDQPLVFSCGSGVSACVIGKAFNIVNNNEPIIYDGSWSEWAIKEGLFT